MTPASITSLLRNITGHLKSDFSVISDWSRRKLVAFSAFSTQFLHYQLDTAFQTTILFPSITCNSVSFLQQTCLVCPLLKILPHVKSAFLKLGGLLCSCQNYSLRYQLNTQIVSTGARLSYAEPHLWFMAHNYCH